MTMIDVAVRDPRTCVSEQVWEREVRLIVRDHGLDRELAERTFGQTVAYLVTSAENPDVRMAPAPAVDKGVHSFILDSPTYVDFCTRYAGGYIHHVPNLSEDGDGETGLVRRTISAIHAAGFIVDTELWSTTSAKCNQCYNGCTDSPKK
jgi:hypothetical protein